MKYRLYVKRFTSQDGSHAISRASRSGNSQISTFPSRLLANLRLLRGVKPMPGSCLASFFPNLDGPSNKPELGFSNWAASLSLPQMQYEAKQQVFRHIPGTVSVYSQLENQMCRQSLSMLDQSGTNAASIQTPELCPQQTGRKTAVSKTNRLVLERSIFPQPGRTNLGTSSDSSLPSIP